MANKDAPFGFKLVGRLGSSVQNNGTTEYEIASGATVSKIIEIQGTDSSSRIVLAIRLRNSKLRQLQNSKFSENPD